MGESVVESTDPIGYLRQFQSVQLAILNSCDGNNPGRVLLPSGTIIANSTLFIPSYCDVGGHGTGKTVIRAQESSNFSNGVVSNSNVIAGNTRISLHDLTIDANNEDYQTVYFSNVTNSSITNTEQVNSGSVLRVGGVSCLLWWSGHGSATANVFNANNLIHGNHFKNCGGDAIGYGGIDSEISFNRIENAGDSGIGMQGFGTAGVVISSNLFINTTCGVCAGPTPGSPLSVGTNDRLSVSHNVIRNDEAPGYGVMLVQSNGSSVVDNSVDIPSGGGNDSPGILIEANNGTSVNNNKIIHAAGQGIYIECVNSTAKTENVVVSGNEISDSGLGGIRVESGVEGCIVRNVTIGNNKVNASGQRGANTFSNIELAQANGAILADAILAGNIARDAQQNRTAQYGLVIYGNPSGVLLSGNTFGGLTAGVGYIDLLSSSIYGPNNLIAN